MFTDHSTNRGTLHGPLHVPSSLTQKVLWLPEERTQTNIPPPLLLNQKVITISSLVIPRCEDFFNNGIVTNSCSFKKRSIMPETRVVVDDIKAFPNIYRIFQFHQFDWMNNASGEYSSHLAREFYESYATTLMNFTAETETTKWGKKDLASTWGPLNSIMVRGKWIDISEATINKMMHGLEYTAPDSIGLFKTSCGHQ
uniref:Uncharacterized protein n=1 Tax=Solanum tuberosum TaxID=4113 RepID=M1E122_SOLTU